MNRQFHKVVRFVEKLKEKGLEKPDIIVRLVNKFPNDDTDRIYDDIVKEIGERKRVKKSLEGQKISFFDKVKINKVLKKGESAVNMIMDEVSPLEQKKYRRRLIESIVSLTDIFEVYVGEKEDELLTNESQLNAHSLDELVELYEQLLEEMERMV